MDYFCVGRLAQFCCMQHDLTWEGFGNHGLFLGMVHGALLRLSNYDHKQGVSPEAEVTLHIHENQCEETSLEVCNAGWGCV